MKELIKQYLDHAISRRNFLSNLAALGMTTTAANSMARSLSAFVSPADETAGGEKPAWLREVRGTGAALLVAQLKAAGVEFVFINPGENSTIYDALVDEPEMHVITAPHECTLAGMADGYAKASGKTPFVCISRPGFPNTVGMLANSFKSRTPIVASMAAKERALRGQDGYEDIDNLDDVIAPLTKWHWVGEMTEKIPELTRRALKFASTQPCGPVFVSFPEDTLREQGKATIMDQSKFTIPMKIRADAATVEKAARLLLEARNPLLYLGDEITRCGAEKEVVELAELLGIPAAWNGTPFSWSMPFPTRHPLYLGYYFSEMRFPGEFDLMLNLGSPMPNPAAAIQLRPLDPKVKVIEMRIDVTNLARVAPVEVPMVADLKLGVTDLIAALRSLATEAKLKQLREPRIEKAKAYTAKMNAYREASARSRWNDPAINIARIGVELEEVLDKETYFVHEIPTARELRYLMSFGGDGKRYFSRLGGTLGWGVAAAFGIKLAHPDRPVAVFLGDGAFLYGGPAPLWCMVRYHAPVTVMICNNRSYDSIRRGSLMGAGRQAQTGRDMGCYLGDPDVDFSKMAASCGMEAEIVDKPEGFRPALERAKRANVDGRPYLLDIHVGREGLGATSTWYPSYSIAAKRQKKV